MYPNLFVIGAAKSGTTSLHYYLDQHPDVHMSKEKEPNHFSYSEEPFKARHAVRDPQRYQALFDTDASVRGEASVSYSFWPYPAGVPERIHAVAPEARFIYIVRDPVARVVSHFRHRVALGEEHRPISEVVADPHEPEERYVTASSYATQMARYLELFPRERFLVLDHAELLAHRAAVLRECFAFLDVDESFTSPNWERRLNDTSSQRQYSALADRVRFSRAYRTTLGWFSPEVRNAIVGPVRRVLTRDVSREEPIGDDVRRHFAALLAPEAERFRSLSGKDFPSWTV
jgi:hypothetical protein